MLQDFSRETRELLDRAQRAIDLSIEVRNARSRISVESREVVWSLGLTLARWHAPASQRKAEKVAGTGVSG